MDRSGPATRVALVVGGSSDIGVAIVTRLAADGTALAVHYRSRAETAESVAAAISGRGGSAIAIQSDVTDLGSVARMLDEVTSRLGPIDTLVYAAADVRFSRFLDSDPADWPRQLEVSLIGFMHCAQPVVRAMARAGWGRVVGVAAEGALVGEPALAVASAAKAGMVGFVRSLAREVAADGVTVNAVAPGFIPTSGIPGRLREPARLERIRQRYPGGRLGTPADVAGTVGYLCSPQAAQITGQVISVGADYSMP